MARGCDLCEAIHSGEFYKYSCFYCIPVCDTCGIPILVLGHHEPTLNGHEQEQFEKVIKTFFLEYRLRGIGMRSNPTHWHEHLVLK